MLQKQDPNESFPMPPRQTAVDPNVLSAEPAEEYHAKAAEFLSSHQLADFRKCPLLYHHKKLGVIVDEDRPAYLVGRAAHTLILEGEECFGRQYAVGGPINPATGRVYGKETKAFAQWAKAQGKPVLTEEQYRLVSDLAAGVSANETAVELLSGGVAEGVVRADYCGVPCQIRLDWLGIYPARIVDLKTCDDLTWFEADARRYGYRYQLAFYQAVLAEEIGERVPVFMVGVEKKPPFRSGTWRVSDDTLAIARQENEAAIRRLIQCRETNQWPTGFEQTRLLDVA